MYGIFQTHQLTTWVNIAVHDHILKGSMHRDRRIHIERDIIGCLYFCQAWLFCKTNKKYFYFFTTQNLGVVSADFLYKSVSELCLFISRIARYLPKQTTFPLYVYTEISLVPWQCQLA